MHLYKNCTNVSLNYRGCRALKHSQRPIGSSCTGASDPVWKPGKINACDVPHVNEEKKNLDRQIASVRENCENGHFIYLNSSVKLAQKESF